MTRWFLVLLVCFSLLTPLSEAVDVVISDPNLEVALRDALGKPTGALTDTDLASLTALDASSRSIVDLTGLEYCTNLTELYLHFNQISDISPLASLTDLWYLSLDSNQIINISAVTNLTDLWYLSLNSNQISDISAVSNLTKLLYLHLHTNQISDINAVANLTKLTRLHLGYNQISDISAVANLTKLTDLSLPTNQISDISPVANLTSLPSLSLDRNQISDISAVANLTKLTYLSLRYNQVIDISAVANLTNLMDLSLHTNQISDISPVANLTKLMGLSLGDQISDISPVANLTNLERLHLYHNQINDISPLASLTNLTTLFLDGNEITDIAPVTNLTNLTTLVLRTNQISDIGPVANLTNLERLFLESNEISNIGPVANLTNLTDLSLSYNQVTDVSPMANLTKLTTLELDSNQASDLQALLDNPGLGSGDSMDVRYNPLNSTAFSTQIPALQARSVSVTFDPYSGNIQLIDENPPGTWNYQLNHTSGSVYGWEYNGSAITGASVDGVAQAAGWEVVTQTNNRVLFASSTPLTTGSLTGFHILGTQGGTGSYDCGTNQTIVDGPLPVTLSSFSATTTQEGVLLTWHTESEESSLGFHISRSVTQDGEYTRVNPELIPGHGTDATPHDYQFLAETNHDNQEAWYQLESISYSGATHLFPPIQVRQAEMHRITDVTPEKFALLPNYPNPFNPETWIPYHLAQDSEAELRIYDTRGYLVRILELGTKRAGIYESKLHAAYWDGRNSVGETVSSGVYFYQLITPTFQQTRRLVVVR